MLEHHAVWDTRGGADTAAEDSEEVQKWRQGEGQDGRGKVRGEEEVDLRRWVELALKLEKKTINGI